MEPLHPEALTWTALLAQWMDFARASVALPPDAEGEAWRAAVPAIITLQAVTFALADFARLPEAERPLARDKAEILIEDSARALSMAWDGGPLPDSIREIESDARVALHAASQV